MLRLALLATAASVLLAGCTTWPLQAGHDGPLPLPADSAGWQPLDCDPTRGASISSNATPVPGFRQSPADVAADIAAALRDPLEAATSDAGDGLAWTTQRGGRLDVSTMPDGSVFMALYTGPARPDGPSVLRLLDSWGVDPATVWMVPPGRLGEGEDRLFQSAAGEPFAWALGGASWAVPPASAASQLAVLPFYDVQEPTPAVGAPAAVDLALAFAECRDGGAGLHGRVMGMGVLHGALSYVVAAAPPGVDSCAARWVYVDAATASIVGSHPGPCA